MHFVTDHHQVLPLWAEYRRGLSSAPRLLTLDHHTDTSLPFRRYLKQQFPQDIQKQEEIRIQLLQQINFRRPESVNEALSILSHDEHILTAIQTDLISAACVVAHNARDTDISTYREHRVICYSVGRNQLLKQPDHREVDGVLESAFLSKALKHFDAILDEDQQLPFLQQNYILDIDLDYFNTHASALPEDKTFFLQLLRGAGLVTVATEPEYVKKCAIDSDLTADKILSSLQSWME